MVIFHKDKRDGIPAIGPNQHIYCFYQQMIFCAPIRLRSFALPDLFLLPVPGLHNRG